MISLTLIAHRKTTDNLNFIYFKPLFNIKKKKKFKLFMLNLNADK